MPAAILREYYRLAKPGIIYGNLLTTVAAFLFASRWQFSLQTFELFAATSFGISFVIGSACVFNNYIDRDIDRRMERTKQRPLVTGTISENAALIYGAVLGLAGLALLVFLVNPLTATIALFGFIMYVFVYGYAKRKSYLGALVGSIPGAVPIVVGYTAVVNRIDAAAVILFLILVAWQMPHFYGIAMFRLDEYKEAGIPVLPAQKGMQYTRRSIIFYIIAFIVAVSLLAIFGYAGYIYLALVLLLGLEWFVHALRNGKDDAKWSKGVFLQSLITLLVFCIILAITPLLPTFPV